MQPKRTLRLPWRRTWPSTPRDYVCESPDADMDGLVGRVHETFDPLGQPLWRWHCSGLIGGNGCPPPHSGAATDKDTAARLVEDRWFAWMDEAKERELIRQHEGNRADWPAIGLHNARAMGRQA